MNLKSTINCLKLYKASLTEEDVLIKNNDKIIKEMLEDQDFYVGMIDVFVKTYSKGEIKFNSSLNIKIMTNTIFIKLLEENYFSRPENIEDHYAAILKYAEYNKELVGNLLFAKPLWIGDEDDYVDLKLTMDEYAVIGKYESLDKYTKGSVISCHTEGKPLNRNDEQDLIYNPVYFYDLLALYKCPENTGYVFDYLKEEFGLMFGIDFPTDKEMTRYFNEFISACYQGTIPLYKSLDILEMNSREEVIEYFRKILTETKKYHKSYVEKHNYMS